MSTLALIPRPVSCNPSEGTFLLASKTPIRFDASSDWVGRAARFAASRLFRYVGIRFRTVAGLPTASDTQASVCLRRAGRARVPHPEGYRLEVTQTRVTLEARAESGMRHAVQTLIQLLPVGPTPRMGSGDPLWPLPAVVIADQPRFGWRGLHLDVGRHFMPVDFVKRYLDLLALHKFNVFHWHLTEDQGWRIEIRRYPRLTAIGAWRAKTEIRREGNPPTIMCDGRPHGGFYTQEDIRDVVRYAAELGIEVLPEIEMPGHCQAALAAYPEYSCTGGPFEVACTWGIKPDVYCPGREETFRFLEEVWNEVLDLFPGKYVHIGGDECPKERWRVCPRCQARIREEGLQNEEELQSWFVRRIERFLNRRGRRLIGWDEILEGGLAPRATVMSWRGEQGGIVAAQSGHDVVMAPNPYTYFDWRYAPPAGHTPETYRWFTPLDKVYRYEPVPAVLTPEQARHVLGAQGQLWTEHMPDSRTVEEMAFPRACALAEVVWSPAEGKDGADFRRRLETHLLRLSRLGVHYTPLEAAGPPEP